MSDFIQLHLLTSYPPANLNRDDQGRPKTANMGGTDRLRISSQSLKRTWRTSDLFQSALQGHIGVRTKRLGVEAYKALCDKEVKDKDAMVWARSIAEVFGKTKKIEKVKDKSKAKDKEQDKEQDLDQDKANEKANAMASLEIEQLVHVSPCEQEAINDLIEVCANAQRAPEKAELDLLRHADQAVDVALFGRMLASKPNYNVEAACQVAHAISVHPIVIEDDYFTAVDDLNQGKDDSGAAHIGETLFAAGLFYAYICINKSLLIENLGDEALAKQAISALTEAAVKVAPEGKQNSFGSRAYATYVLAEKGEQQPRSLSAAFLKAIDQRSSDDYALSAIEALKTQYEAFDKVYGPCADDRMTINVLAGEGTLPVLLQFVSA